MRGGIVLSSEMFEAGTWAPSDFFATDGLSCHLCGLTPANILLARRTNPRTALLEPGGIAEGDPLRRTVYRCRNRKACERRQELRRGRAEDH